MIDTIDEYKAAGNIRHVGFSTHRGADFITHLIKTDEFEYVNLRYHGFGSNTASGDDEFGSNLRNIRLMKDSDIGVHTI